MAKEDKKVETAKQEPVVHIYEKDMKPKQKVLNLDTMEDSEIQLFYKEYSINTDAPIAEVLKAAQKLVQPAEKHAKALVEFASREAYKLAKEKALSVGNYMSTALRGALTDIMSRITQFADNKAADNFAYWAEAYKDKANPERQAKAKKLLERAKMLVDSEEFGTM